MKPNGPAVLFASLVSTACAIGPSPEAVLAQDPPPLVSVRAEIDAAPCSNPDHQYQNRQVADTRNVPLLVSGCYAYMPQIVIDARIQGACVSMFDLDTQGAPINIETRCQAASANQLISKAWEELAVGAFIHATRAQLTSTRYAPLVQRAPGERGENIPLITNFGIEGERFVLRQPLPFQRSGAPPLPEDVLNRLNQLKGQ